MISFCYKYARNTFLGVFLSQKNIPKVVEGI